MKSKRQKKLQEYNEVIVQMEQQLQLAELSIALVANRAAPELPAQETYTSVDAALRRIREINHRLDDLADEYDAIQGLGYSTTPQAGSLARVLNTWLDPQAPSQERLINYGR